MKLLLAAAVCTIAGIALIAARSYVGVALLVVALILLYGRTGTGSGAAAGD